MKSKYYIKSYKMGDKKCLGDGDGFWDKCGEVVEWSERVVVTAFGCGEVVEWSERVVVTEAVVKLWKTA